MMVKKLHPMSNEDDNDKGKNNNSAMMVKKLHPMSNEDDNDKGKNNNGKDDNYYNYNNSFESLYFRML